MTKTTYVDEYRAVIDAIGKYLEGGAKAESSIMQPAFHSDAAMFTVNEESEITRAPSQALFDGIDNDFTPSTPKSAVVTVDIVGTVASARVDSDDFDGFRFSDFFHLLKANGAWQIVAKTFYTHPSAS